jgi:YHS domain-containing protein
MRSNEAAKRSIATLAIALMLAGCAVYNITHDGADADLMLRGYDPVSYFKGATPTRGEATITARHRYGTYRFASDAHRSEFLRDPERYVPQYGAFCAKGVSYAVRAGGDPLVYAIRDERLFIFAVPYARDYWLTDPREFVDKADFYWRTEMQDRSATLHNLYRYVFRVPHYKTYPEEFADYEKRTGKPAPRAP